MTGACSLWGVFPPYWGSFPPVSDEMYYPTYVTCITPIRPHAYNQMPVWHLYLHASRVLSAYCKIRGLVSVDTSIIRQSIRASIRKQGRCCHSHVSPAQRHTRIHVRYTPNTSGEIRCSIRSNIQAEYDSQYTRSIQAPRYAMQIH